MADDLQDQIAAMMAYDSGDTVEEAGDADDTNADDGSGGTGAAAADGEGAAETGTEKTAEKAGGAAPSGEEDTPPSGEDSGELSLEDENARLRARLETVLKANQEPQAASTEAPSPLGELEFDPFAGEDVSELVDNPDRLKSVVTDAFSRFGQAIRDNMAQRLPELVKNYANETIGVQERAREFYDDNQDLKPYKRYVQYKMKELHGAEPDKDLDTLLTTTAAEVRKDLGLKAASAAGEPAPRRADKPPLKERNSASSRRSQKPEEAVDDLQKEIDAMEQALEF